MFPGNDLFVALEKAIVKPDYQEAMYLIERLVHAYRYWRNSPPVIEWASVTYYQTGHLSYAKNWAMTYLCASSRKTNPWKDWYDEHYLWRFTEFTSFVNKVAMICDSPPDLDLQGQVSEILLALRRSLNSEDFLKSTVSDFGERISQFHQQIIAPFSSKLQGLDLREVFNVIQIVGVLDNLREDDAFSEHILPVPVQQVSQKLAQSMQSGTLEEIYHEYGAALRLLSSGFSTPMPERITYREYWKKAQISILSDYVHSLNTQFSAERTQRRVILANPESAKSLYTQVTAKSVKEKPFTMEKEQCQICHLPISVGDALYGRVIVRREGSVHTYCEAMTSGQVPKCPLYESINPKPLSRDCAFAVNNPELHCSNMICGIGRSARVLRGIDGRPAQQPTGIPTGYFFGQEFDVMIYGEEVKESAFFQAFDGTCPECGVNPDKCPPNDKLPGLDGFMIPFGCYDCNHFNLVPLVVLREAFVNDEFFTVDCERCRTQIEIPDTVICSKCGIFLRKDAQRLIDECNNRSSVTLYYKR